MKKISLQALPELFEALKKQMKVYLPIEKAGQVNFEEYSENACVRFDALNTVKSPKDLFFPQTENMVAFKMEGKNIEIIQQERMNEPFCVMGVRPCDVRAMAVLDKVFLANPVDTFYAARREHGTVISLACNKPEETCFCKVFGVDASEPEGDIAAWLTEGEMLLKAQTEKGEKLLKSVESLLEDASDNAADEKKAGIKGEIEKQPFMNLSLGDFENAELMDVFNSEKWKSLYTSCLGCGTCTFVCPTCQCYDIRDYDTGNGVQRFRCWDSCMYSDFTLMAHGNNRTTQMERFRQRFMHKLVYFPNNNNGMYSCVGCGRCVAKCPVHMNIIKVIKAMGGKENA